VTTLSTYILDTRRLLHDASGRYWTDVDLTAYVNKARNRVIADTSCNRKMQNVYLSTGLEQYTYGGVTGCSITTGGTGYASNFAVTFTGTGTGATGTAVVSGGAVTDVLITSTGTGYTTAPTVSFAAGSGTGATATSSIVLPTTMDLVNIVVLWGNLRIVLDRMSYTQFVTTLRSWQGFSQRPTTWAQYGQQGFFIGPIPDQTYTAELDSIITPTDLVNSSDVDSDIATLYQDPIPFYAAHWAKFQEQAFQEAEMFKGLYNRKIQECLRSTMLRKLSSAYGS